MSQVVVTHDALQKSRDASLVQEKNIDSESEYQHWRMSDATKTHPVAKMVGVATFPILALWSLLSIGLGFAVALIVGLMKVLGRLMPGAMAGKK